MDNRILIEMTSIQTVDGQADTNRLTYHGRYQETDGKAILQYMQVDEMGRTRNKLEVWDDDRRYGTGHGISSGAAHKHADADPYGMHGYGYCHACL